MGNDVATLPDYPAEIRAPAGTVSGVSGFQVRFARGEVFTPGDRLDVLVAMNPAALKVNVGNVKPKGIIVVNSDAFVEENLTKAGYTVNPLTDHSLSGFQVLSVPLLEITRKALEGLGLDSERVERCKNFTALGFTYWLFNRSKEHTLKWMEKKFSTKSKIMEANQRALDAGFNYGVSGEVSKTSYRVGGSEKKRSPGVYRHVSGNAAAALGLLAAANRSGLRLFLGSYPITPATDIMQTLTKYPKFATVFQAEDEIAAIGASIGASYGGALAATNTSGPGFSLKTEFLNLAVMVELPLIVVNVQRAGPSTGLPTKTEQSDLFQALWGRHGESPLAVLAASSPRDCFDVMLEASRIAIKYMTPVVVLSDGFLGNGSQVWKVPDLNSLPKIEVSQRPKIEDFRPYGRDSETLARQWAVPGTFGLEHRVGGLEKEDVTGVVSHSPENHEKMIRLRAEKIARIARDIPPVEVEGDEKADLLVLGWGSTKGVILETVRKLRKEGMKLACAHLRYLNPMPGDLKALLERYPKVLVPENNSGQLWYRLRAEYLLDTIRFNKIQGQPFRADEIESKIREVIGETGGKK
jgi:2-oxoglutarate ferredoxin oxidoreductase subunit alpha